MACHGGIDEGEKQRLGKLNLLFSPPHDATCSICESVVEAYLIGSEWVLKQHDAPLHRRPQGRGAKQTGDKLCIKGGDITPRLRARKAPKKPTARKRRSRKR
jgi:hypothetical protein